jgi:hypothetical protein
MDCSSVSAAERVCDCDEREKADLFHAGKRELSWIFKALASEWMVLPDRIELSSYQYNVNKNNTL